ncbi:hypothetical protein FQR65_LT10031 [Abscondita terminalis]|nr:hypothetical protein FQR65_LT10031 [Abscondita terminalis]
MPFKPMNLQEQYDKCVNLKKSDIQYIQKWLEKQPHLPPISEIELVYFLHSCYYSIEKTKATIDSFFTLKTACPEFFGKKDSEELKMSLNEAVYAPLPTLTPEGYQVIFTKLLNCNPDTYDFGNHMKYLSTCIHIWLMETGNVNGIVFVFDMDGCVLGHVTKIPITSFKKIVTFLQEALPIRLKGIHCINTAPFIDMLLSLIKPFMNLELMSLLHFHTKSLDTLFQYVPLECLPTDYGGSEVSVAELHESSKHVITDNSTFIEEQEKRNVDEKKD